MDELLNIKLWNTELMNCWIDELFIKYINRKKSEFSFHIHFKNYLRMLKIFWFSHLADAFIQSDLQMRTL